jgi:hypothetical protein
MAGGGYWWQHQGQQAAELVRGTLLDVEAELGRSPRDRSALGRLILRLSKLPDADREPNLVRAQARIRLAQNRLMEAWDLLSGLAEALDAEPGDLWLGAGIVARRHALSGKKEEARLARSLAERHYELSGEPRSLLRAWQGAHRAGDREEELRLAGQLLEGHPDSLEAELLSTWGNYFAEEPAGRATLGELLELEIRFAEVPLELEIMLVMGLLETQEEGDQGAASDRVQRLLPDYSAIVDLRYYAAVVDHLGGRIDQRNAHLDWLLEAAPDDSRQERWRRLRRGR